VVQHLLRQAALARARSEGQISEGVEAARRAAVSWKSIGAELAITAQAALQRYGAGRRPRARRSRARCSTDDCHQARDRQCTNRSTAAPPLQRYRPHGDDHCPTDAVPVDPTSDPTICSQSVAADPTAIRARSSSPLLNCTFTTSRHASKGDGTALHRLVLRRSFFFERTPTRSDWTVPGAGQRLRGKHRRPVPFRDLRPPSTRRQLGTASPQQLRMS